MNVILKTPENNLWHHQHERIRNGIELPVHHGPDLALVPEEIRRETVALVAYDLSEHDLGLLPKLRFIAVPKAGVDTLPLSDLARRDVAVVNAHANGRWVAERALALLLAVTGKIVPGDRDLRTGRWHGFAAGEPPQIAWRSLSEMTIAIIGTGSIGTWVARFLRPFGSTIIGVRRRSGIDGIPSGLFDEVYTDLDAALHAADAAIVTLPSTPETTGLIGSDRLKLLSDGVLVNVGRGNVIDEEALFHAVAAGRISCGLDTWYRYPDPPGSREYPSRFPFEGFDNVVLSPHLGGYLTPATRASADDVVARLIDWIRKGMPAGVDGAADLEAGY
ncbi:MAG: NAD(P)-dependent oxidoreductase [Alkalispirochaeta sp.]